MTANVLAFQVSQLLRLITERWVAICDGSVTKWIERNNTTLNRSRKGVAAAVTCWEIDGRVAGGLQY